jgi:hypothetical protein
VRWYIKIAGINLIKSKQLITSKFFGFNNWFTHKYYYMIKKEEYLHWYKISQYMKFHNSVNQHLLFLSYNNIYE